jgi:putative ABC transport system permease protein
VRGLPLDYAIRNLMRHPLRTLLTAGASALVTALLVATTSFVRGLDGTFSGAAQSDTAILLSSVAQRDVVRSSISAGLGELVGASVPGVVATSGEIHMGTSVRLGAEDGPIYPGFVRGVSDEAYSIHEAVTVTSGRLPHTGEVLVGRLAASQMGVDPSALSLGEVLWIESSPFEIVGTFSAPGTTLEAELWTPVAPLRGIVQRDDDSVLFVRMASSDFADLSLFTARRLDLELVMIPTAVYYRELTDYFGPIRSMAWALAVIIAGAALFGGANTMGAAVQDRMRELATLRAVGYSGWHLARSLAQESVLLACAGGLAGLMVARFALDGTSVGLAMSAFALELDAVSILVGFAGAFLLGILGVAPAAFRASRISVALALKDT